MQHYFDLTKKHEEMIQDLHFTIKVEVAPGETIPLRYLMINLLMLRLAQIKYSDFRKWFAIKTFHLYCLKQLYVKCSYRCIGCKRLYFNFSLHFMRKTSRTASNNIQGYCLQKKFTWKFKSRQFKTNKREESTGMLTRIGKCWFVDQILERCWYVDQK